MVTPAAEREAFAHLRNEYEMGERRGFQLLQCCRMTVRYISVRADDSSFRDRMNVIAHERRRFGYRLIHVLLRREGMTVNHNTAVQALSSGKAVCAQTRRPQKSSWNTGLHACAADAQPALETRLRLRSNDRRTQIQRVDHHG